MWRCNFLVFSGYGGVCDDVYEDGVCDDGVCPYGACPYGACPYGPCPDDSCLSLDLLLQILRYLLLVLLQVMQV